VRALESRPMRPDENTAVVSTHLDQ
jgi:hypothetical protein